MFPISDANPLRRGAPYVNLALLLINTLVFVYELSLNEADQTIFFYKYGLIPRELTEGISFTELRPLFGPPAEIESPVPTWLTIFTSMFIHGGVLHFAGNMVFLWVFGDNVEDRLGHFWYLVFYLAFGVAAAWTQTAVNMHSELPNIGASGAISGVLGAYLVLYPYNQVRTVVIFFFITIVRLPAVYLLGAWFLLQLFSGVGSLSQSVDVGGVAYWAHIGGFGAGVLTVLGLKLFVWRERLIPRAPRRRDFWQW